MSLKFVLVNKGKGIYNNDNPISENDLFEIDSDTVETDPTVPTYVKSISETDIQNWVEGFDNNLISGSVTGDKNKTITLTRRDGTTLSVPFIDNEGVTSDDVLNTLDFDKNTGVVTAVTSEGIQITANFDGRYSLLGHTHPEYEHTHPASHPISFIDNLTQSLAAKVDNNKVLTDVPLNALFTDTVYDENISARRVLVPVSALPADFTSTDVMDWLNANEGIGDSEILFWETTGEAVVVTLAVNILTPTEGQEITGDVNITFELFNESSINITSPTEGQEITGDVNITFEII